MCNPSPFECQHNLICFTYLCISPQLLLYVGSSLKHSSAHSSSQLVTQWNNGTPFPPLPKTSAMGSTSHDKQYIPLSRGIHFVSKTLLMYILGLVLEKFPKGLLNQTDNTWCFYLLLFKKEFTYFREREGGRERSIDLGGPLIFSLSIC